MSGQFISLMKQFTQSQVTRLPRSLYNSATSGHHGEFRASPMPKTQKALKFLYSSRPSVATPQKEVLYSTDLVVENSQDSPPRKQGAGGNEEPALSSKALRMTNSAMQTDAPTCAHSEGPLTTVAFGGIEEAPQQVPYAPAAVQPVMMPPVYQPQYYYAPPPIPQPIINYNMPGPVQPFPQPEPAVQPPAPVAEPADGQKCNVERPAAQNMSIANTTILPEGGTALLHFEIPADELKAGNIRRQARQANLRQGERLVNRFTARRNRERFALAAVQQRQSFIRAPRTQQQVTQQIYKLLHCFRDTLQAAEWDFYLAYFRVETLARKNLQEFIDTMYQFTKNAVISNYLKYRQCKEIQFVYYVLMTQTDGQMSWDDVIAVFEDIPLKGVELQVRDAVVCVFRQAQRAYGQFPGVQRAAEIAAEQYQAIVNKINGTVGDQYPSNHHVDLDLDQAASKDDAAANAP